MVALLGVVLLLAAYANEDMAPTIRGLVGSFGLAAVSVVGLVEGRRKARPAVSGQSLSGAESWWIPARSLPARISGTLSSLAIGTPGTAEVSVHGIDDHSRYHSLIRWEEIHHYVLGPSGLQLHLHDRDAFRGPRMVRFGDRLSRGMGYGTLNIVVPGQRIPDIAQALDFFLGRNARQRVP